MSLGMLRIQLRRTGGLWLLPLPAAAVWYVTATTQPDDVTLWPAASVGVQLAVALVGPLVAGWAAWLGGRDRAHGLIELLATTPRPAPVHDLTRWAAAALWSGLAFVLGVALVLGDAWREATWGGPTWWPIRVGVLAVLVCAAAGYAAGVWRPSRFTPPLVAIGTYLALAFPLGQPVGPSLRYLTPLPVEFSPQVFFAIEPDLGAELSLWLLGLAAVALSGVALRSTRTPVTWGALGLGVLLAGIGASLILQTSPPSHEVRIPYTPVCDEGRVTVCMHPAYERLLPRTADLMDRLTEPLAGVPGLPALLWPASHPPRPDLPEDTTRFYFSDTWSGDGFEERQIAWALVGVDACGPPPLRDFAPLPSGSVARAAVAAWLLQQAGVDRDWWGLTDDVRPTFERFTALRSCELGAEDLP